MQKGIEYSFDESLERKQENRLFVKLVLSELSGQVEEFVISQISMINERPAEIIRFDASKKENPNVHRFYSKNREKQYLAEKISYDTVMRIMQNIRDNWHIYRVKYEENH
ncbi:MAG: hypothetical protein NUV67_04015 [archaeon]|nr:hypothetical protein [archaeon]